MRKHTKRKTEMQMETFGIDLGLESAVFASRIARANCRGGEFPEPAQLDRNALQWSAPAHRAPLRANIDETESEAIITE